MAPQLSAIGSAAKPTPTNLGARSLNANRIAPNPAQIPHAQQPRTQQHSRPRASCRAPSRPIAHANAAPALRDNYDTAPTEPQRNSKTTARHVRWSTLRCHFEPHTPNAANAQVTRTRDTVGMTVGPSDNANCQSAYSNQLANCSQTGARRGHSPGRSYCRRPTT